MGLENNGRELKKAVKKEVKGVKPMQKVDKYVHTPSPLSEKLKYHKIPKSFLSSD